MDDGEAKKRSCAQLIAHLNDILKFRDLAKLFVLKRCECDLNAHEDKKKNGCLFLQIIKLELCAPAWYWFGDDI